MRVRMLFLALALAGFSAHGENSDDENKGRVIAKPVLADTPEAFATQARWIEDEMEPGGRYEFAKAADKQRVKVVLEQMGTLLQRAGSVAAMDQGTKVVLFNDQEEINGLLTHNDANRLVCESRQPVGSHIPVTHCHTYRQIEETARNTKAGMQQYDLSRLCNGSGPDGNPCAPGGMQQRGGRTSGH